MSGKVLSAPTPAGIRDELQDLVLKDLLGPAGGPEEELTEQVSERYLVGMLAPRNKFVPQEEDEGLESEESTSTEDGSKDASLPVAGSMFPSSIGMSFCVSGEATGFRATARWGWYRRVRRDVADDGGDKAPMVWKRTQVEGAKSIGLSEGPVEPWVVSDEQPDVTVKGLVRKVDGNFVASLFIVNGQTETKTLKDEQWLFQPELVVEDEHGEAIFCRRGVSAGRNSTEREDLRMEMVYRDFVEFAVGHGVGVHCDTAPGDIRRAVRIRTRTVPRYEVPQQESPTADDIPSIADLELEMKVLSETPGDRLPGMLAPLTRAYESWIEEQKARLGGPEFKQFREQAEETVALWERSLSRIRDGIELLGRDQTAAEAFRFANNAMYQQRLRTMIAERRRKDPSLKVADLERELNRPKTHMWRIFQLGFIIQNLAGLTRFDSPDRSVDMNARADLLWFPTGGGKTEAYLGLAAYVLGIRRLQGVVANRDGEHGVAVLMRYTLRLLTLQQFQRATALICACEAIRRRAPDRWGKEPFRIGLWVGMKSTPNSTDKSAEWLRQHRGTRGANYGTGIGSGTPAQLTTCPWCGTAISPEKDMSVETYEAGACRTLVYCGDALGQCEFSQKKSPGEGIPAVVVDDEIYRRLPALLIATVDKFAQLPWNGKTQMLFGQVTGHCPRHGFISPEIMDASSHSAKGAYPQVNAEVRGPLRPPDLIIQDELHLISGPLGTLVGLYETAVDRLCTWEVNGRLIRPKVIASTATVRRAGDQLSGIFLRKVDVFPPQGLDSSDNFFSVQRDISRMPGRSYMGICATGKRLKAALIRVYVSFLAAGQLLYNQRGAVTDPWMTTVGYFNSIRELAGMRRLVEDDIRSRLKVADRRGLAVRRAPILEELTSRISSASIPRLLDKMEIEFNPGTYPQSKSASPTDVLLATNMISVGVDVKRLGLMIVAGQPKTTAEYIQATSRVGRKFPGVVCTIFNWARPRDLSHYESFEHYHSTFYKHVEALSVTPYASRAVDRGLSALLVSLIRQIGQEYNGNEKAQTLDRNHPFVKEAVRTILDRAGGIVQSKSAVDEINAMLERRLDEWLAEAARGVGSKLGYKESEGDTRGLLKFPGKEDWLTFTCLNSLRDVEPNVKLILLNDAETKDDPLTPAGNGG